tara:strand:- start:6295 stop:6546 length:252 start_codon:yes stop_codon:yes gene_type:complete
MKNINEATYLLKKTYKVLLCIENILNSKELGNLSKDIQRFLDETNEYEEIEQTQFEQLDERLQVIESFLDSVQSVASEKKQLS